jgi:hypothetical protein
MSIFETAKAAANILKEAGKIDEYRTILELLDDLLEKRNQISNLNEEILALKQKLTVKNNYIFQNWAYYTKDTNDGPFCPSCYDSNFNAIRIFKSDPKNIHAKCPVCKNDFNITGRSSSQEGLEAMRNCTNSLKKGGF